MDYFYFISLSSGSIKVSRTQLALKQYRSNSGTSEGLWGKFLTFQSLYLFICLYLEAYRILQFPNQGLSPWQLKHGVPSTGPSGNSLKVLVYHPWHEMKKSQTLGKDKQWIMNVKQMVPSLTQFPEPKIGHHIRFPLLLLLSLSP